MGGKYSCGVVIAGAWNLVACAVKWDKLGIYLDNTPFWEKYGKSIQNENRPVIGIIVNGQNKERAIEFLRYLFE